MGCYQSEAPAANGVLAVYTASMRDTPSAVPVTEVCNSTGPVIHPSFGQMSCAGRYGLRSELLCKISSFIAARASPVVFFVYHVCLGSPGSGCSPGHPYQDCLAGSSTRRTSGFGRLVKYHEDILSTKCRSLMCTKEKIACSDSRCLWQSESL